MQDDVTHGYSPAEIEFLQCLMDRYSEGDGFTALVDDHRAFMAIVRKHAAARHRIQAEQPRSDAPEAGLAGEMRDLARRYEDTMGLTREGAIRRVEKLHDALLDFADRLAALTATEQPRADVMEALGLAEDWFKDHFLGNADDPEPVFSAIVDALRTNQAPASDDVRDELLRRAKSRIEQMEGDAGGGDGSNDLLDEIDAYLASLGAKP